MAFNHTPDYDPTIQGLLSQCQADWRTPEQNRKGLVPYGIRLFDKALYGIDVNNGELNVILGPEKQRKTTFLVNIIINVMTSVLERGGTPPSTVIDALESGMNPKRYRDTLISNMATRILLAKGHTANTRCPVCNTDTCRQMGITHEFLRYHTRSAEQQEAIDGAMEQMYMWPLHIYGANPSQGDTRNLDASIAGKTARWEWLIKERNAKLFAVDHVQQYRFEKDATDYEKQLRAIDAHGNIVAKYNIADFVLSQVSLGSLRESKNGNGKIGAAGGQKAAQEANVVFSVRYVPGSGQVQIAIEESRKSGNMTVVQSIEEQSGAFFGEAVSMFQVQP